MRRPMENLQSGYRWRRLQHIIKCAGTGVRSPFRSRSILSCIYPGWFCLLFLKLGRHPGKLLKLYSSLCSSRGSFFFLEVELGFFH